MKKLSILAIIIVLSSCAKSVYIDTLRPALITFPEDVHSVVLVDRTEPSSKLLNTIEGIFTGEMPGQDRAAIEVALQAIQSRMMSVPSLGVKRATERLQGNSLTMAFPDPLTWEEVANLCNKYQTDIVMAVEVFDSNFIVTDGKRDVTKTVEVDGVKKEVKVAEFYAEGVATTKIGFRIYDPATKSIIDQDQFNQSNTWQAAGNSLQQALTGLIAKSEATKHVARLAALEYSGKIVPTPIQLSRTFYKKSKESVHLTQGVRQAEVNQWDKAINTWKNGIASNPHPKDAANMSYNIAVGYEVMGDFQEAKNWAARSYTQYGNKKGRNYIPLLERRIWDEQQLQKQLK